MNIRDKFLLYKCLYTEILSAFDVGGWEQIDDRTASKWRHNERHGDMTFYDNDCEYSLDDARFIKEVDGLALFYCRDNGDKFYALFDTQLKLTQEND